MRMPIKLASSLRILLVLVSLSTGLLSCQTIGQGDGTAASEKQKQVLESQRQLVRSALDKGKPEEALKSLRDLLREHPEDGQLQNLMGLTQLALKNPDRAIRHLLKAYKIEHKVAVALNLTSAYIENGDFEKAQALLKAMVKQADKEKYQYKERIYHNLGYVHVRLNQQTTAANWFKEALDENPTFFPSYLELARIYEKMKRPAMAAKTYRQSLEYCGVCFEPVYSLTMLYVNMKKFADARLVLHNFSKNEGVAPNDRAAAVKLMKLVDSGARDQRKG